MGDISDEDPEVKREVKACTTSLRKGCDPLLEYSQKCYKDNLLQASKGDRAPQETSKYITLEEIRRAERQLFKGAVSSIFNVALNSEKTHLCRWKC